MNSSADTDSNGSASSSPKADTSAINLEQCAKPNLWKEYFIDAEPQMDKQWEERIWPIISGFDFSNTLEIAPGGGRNSAKLAEHADSLTLIDYNEYCIELCQERFADHPKRESMQFFVNDGRSLDMIESGTVTAIYSWDSFVHIDKEIIHDYFREFGRVLAPGGNVFLHHSNLGGNAESIRDSPHWRSNMTAKLAKKYAVESSLEVASQHIFDWGSSPKIDCISILHRPA